MANNPDLQALLDETTDVEGALDSAVTFIGGVPGLIDAAVQKALANGATAEELKPLGQLSTDLKAKSAAIRDAIAANNPPPPQTIP